MFVCLFDKQIYWVLSFIFRFLIWVQYTAAWHSIFFFFFKQAIDQFPICLGLFYFLFCSFKHKIQIGNWSKDRSLHNTHQAEISQIWQVMKTYGEHILEAKNSWVRPFVVVTRVQSAYFCCLLNFCWYFFFFLFWKTRYKQLFFLPE